MKTTRIRWLPTVLAVIFIFAGSMPIRAVEPAAKAPADKIIPLRLTVDQRVRVSRRKQLALDDIGPRLSGVVQRLRQQGLPSARIVVHLAADDKAKCGDLDRLIRDCQEARIERFVIKLDRDYSFTASLTAPAAASPENSVPAIRVRLRAAEDGSLADIFMDQLQLPSVDKLQNHVLKLVGDERGPGSLAEAVEVEIIGDEDLHFKHLGAAYMALAGQRDAQGKWVPLIKNLFPTGHRYEEELEEEFVEELVEAEVEELEKTDVDFSVEVTETADGVELPAIGSDPLPEFPPAETDDALPAPRVVPGAVTKSESVVGNSLGWLASQQEKDGGWSFAPQGENGKPRFENPGTATTARNGATALAVLAMLGAGQTHAKGEFKKNVHGGLSHLVRNMKVTANRGSLLEPGGHMYSHGLATLALCEAWGMTGDKHLKTPAQLAVNYIVFAQDPVGGGWRYRPRQAGDTSVTAIQVMALRSARLTQLNIPKTTMTGATNFLDSVQSEKGARYGYTTPSTKWGTTAMGLLCRMHLGWKLDRPALARGVDLLAGRGASKDNIYYNFYATNVLFHYGGQQWAAWNAPIRDQLIESQVKEGPSAGSWFFAGSDPGAKAGGRLYCTCVATLILETYYRHLSIFMPEPAENPAIDVPSKAPSE